MIIIIINLELTICKDLAWARQEEAPGKTSWWLQSPKLDFSSGQSHLLLVPQESLDSIIGLSITCSVSTTSPFRGKGLSPDKAPQINVSPNWVSPPKRLRSLDHPNVTTYWVCHFFLMHFQLSDLSFLRKYKVFHPGLSFRSPVF